MMVRSAHRNRSSAAGRKPYCPRTRTRPLCSSVNLVIEKDLPEASGEGCFYHYVSNQLTKLVKSFSLEKSQAKIAQTYQMICRESLAIPCGQPSNFSRINEDGTPFQYSLTLAAGCE